MHVMSDAAVTANKAAENLAGCAGDWESAAGTQQWQSPPRPAQICLVWQQPTQPADTAP